VLLNGVSCPNGPVCVAVGVSEMHDVGPIPLAERRIGSNWSVLPVGDLGNLTGIQLIAVSCSAHRACHATGNGLLAARFDGASWQLESVPFPPTVSFPFLAGVSCPSRFFCMAVGGHSLHFTGGTLAARWTP
jgi:hypothetical protein